MRREHKCDIFIILYKQVWPSAALASRRALRPANGRPQCSIPSTISIYLSLHKCAYRATSSCSVAY